MEHTPKDISLSIDRFEKQFFTKSITSVDGIRLRSPLIFTILLAAILILAAFIYYYNSYSDIEYLFLQDQEFETDTSACTRKWLPLNRTPQQDSFSIVDSGIAWLRYYGQNASAWGTSSLLQGELPHNWRNHSSLISGKTLSFAKEVDGIRFDRSNLPRNGRYLMRVRAKIINRTLLADPSDMLEIPKANVGIALYCSYTIDGKESNYSSPDTSTTVALHLDIFFSSFSWEATTFVEEYNRHLTEGTPPWDNDFHIALTPYTQITDVGSWVVLAIDMNWALSEAFSIFSENEYDVNSITVRGAQIYVESIGCLIEAQIDYVRLEALED